MIDPAELAICRRRGHSTKANDLNKWEQCQWCKMWLRQVKTTEEREDEPPAAEQSAFRKLTDHYGLT
jgi:hypothetical protein